MSAQGQAELSEAQWQQANLACLAHHRCRLRLFIERRIRWLRSCWHTEGPEALHPQVIRDSAADRLLRGEDPAEAAAFYEQDPVACEIGQSIARIEQALAEQAALLAEAGRPPAVEVFCQLFGLNAFERDTLLLCEALESDSSFGRLYAYVQDDANLRYVTPQLALALFSIQPGDHVAALRCLTPEAPLRRFQLIQLGASAPRTLRAISIDERIVDYLNGFNRLDERLAEVVGAVPDLPMAPAHESRAEEILEWVRPNGKRSSWQAVNLFGPPGSGRVAMARALATRMGLRLYRVDVSRLPAPGPDRGEMFRLLAREAILSQLALYVETDESGEAGAASAFEDFVERLPVFFLAGSRARLRSTRELLGIPVPRLDDDNRKQVWLRALARAGCGLNGQTDPVVEQFEFGPEMVTQAVAAAAVKSRMRGEEAISPADLWDACREQSSGQLRQLAQRISPVYTWQDIVLPEAVLRQLREIAAQVKHRTRVYQEWGFGVKLARGRGISALFSGVSGTGKTMAAEIMANDLGLDLYRVDLAGVVSKYIGETEKNLRRIFEAAERSGAILFFDEADALFGRRTEVKDSHDRFANIEIDYLLQRVEEYRGMSILATNRKSDLDRAFLRRIRFLVDFPFPEAEQRLLIWRSVFPPETPLDALDYDMLSRMEIAGGNIRNIALSAAFLAADSAEPVGMKQLVHAARREYTKMDKMLSDAEFHRAFAQQQGKR